ncbi:hypothetical protein Y032_0087g2045 [Ancylostoma ceylanicum]|uniref:Uncharacterized protein n=1 Tax=Ancylostoma ceylanicum TaxID=53326 RepID=A0A016TP23_9BILA|nr:hypothetical protein Y032_0087g2045 [Ancylostoma ceylanicum]
MENTTAQVCQKSTGVELNSVEDARIFEGFADREVSAPSYRKTSQDESTSGGVRTNPMVLKLILALHNVSLFLEDCSGAHLCLFSQVRII